MGRARADVHGELSALALARQDLALASTHLLEAQRMCADAGDLRAASNYGRTAAKILAQQPGALEPSLRVLRQAMAQGRLSGDLKSTLAAAGELVKLHQQRGDHTKALAVIDEATDDAIEHNALIDAAWLLRARSQSLAAMGLSAEAVRSLTHAVQAAHDGEDTRVELELRWELYTLEQSCGLAPTETLEALKAEALRHEAFGVLNDIVLSQAATLLGRGLPQRAMDQLIPVRDHALERLHASRYLQACLLISKAQEQQGNRPAALYMLLTCRQNMAKLLGPEGTKPVEILLHGLHEQWGERGFAAALESMKSRGPSRGEANEPPPHGT